jgi:hypothetical protein
MAVKRERTTRRGVTLIELVIYFALSIAAGLILMSLFMLAGRGQESAYASYLVSGNMATTIRMIRKELQATALASITVLPAGATSGFSCVSAYDDKGEFKLGAYGAPHWQKHVYYSVNAEGDITRWTAPIANQNFLPTLAPAAAAVTPATARVLMPDALPPNTAVGDADNKDPDRWHPASPSGGLELGFVQRNGTVVPVNPRDSATPAQNTRLVQVILRLFERERGPNFMEVKFRVSPRF